MTKTAGEPFLHPIPTFYSHCMLKSLLHLVCIEFFIPLLPCTNFQWSTSAYTGPSYSIYIEVIGVLHVILCDFVQILYEFIWFYADSICFWRFYMIFYDFIWFFMDFIWIYAILYGFYMIFCDFIRILYEFTWFYANLYGFYTILCDARQIVVANSWVCVGKDSNMCRRLFASVCDVTVRL